MKPAEDSPRHSPFIRQTSPCRPLAANPSPPRECSVDSQQKRIEIDTRIDLIYFFILVVAFSVRSESREECRKSGPEVKNESIFRPSAYFDDMHTQRFVDVLITIGLAMRCARSAIQISRLRLNAEERRGGKAVSENFPPNWIKVN